MRAIKLFLRHLAGTRAIRTLADDQELVELLYGVLANRIRIPASHIAWLLTTPPYFRHRDLLLLQTQATKKYTRKI
ncbi:MAG: hypothetical protein WCT24_01880 [Patescibacteria group bacterium]